MHLLIGLGNPGKSYKGHRHNIGFMAIERIAEDYGFPPFQSKFGGLIADGRIEDKRTLLFMPQSYMNNSGIPAREAAQFYKIPPEQIIVFHDELDLPLQKLRVKQGGGAGGHNGLKSLDQHVGQNYWRVRLGIGHPGDKELVTGHVLSNFSKDELKTVASWLTDISDQLPLLMAGDAPKFMSKLAAEG